MLGSLKVARLCPLIIPWNPRRNLYGPVRCAKKDIISRAWDIYYTIDFFKNKITVIGHSIAWDTTGDRDEHKCIDVDPFDVFNSPVVKDPLE